MKLDSRKELTPVFYSNMPVKTATFSVRPNCPCFKEHWHERMELLHIDEGSMNVTVGAKNFSAKKGDTVVVCPERVHIGSSFESGVSYRVLMFDTAAYINSTFAVKSLIEGLTKGSRSISALVHDDDISKIFDDIFSAVQKNTDESAMYIEGCVYLLLSFLFERHSEALAPILPQKRFDMVFNYIAENLDRDLSTETLCKVFGYDKSYFCRRFKADSGLSPSGYVRIMRLEKSKKLLSSGVNIGNAAVFCGFSSYGYFARCFKAEYKMTPREFIKRNAK